jgi:cytochrome c-type biogenesis protein
VLSASAGLHGVYFYAFTLGLVAAVNPCGFPLLPAYLTLLVETEAGGEWSQKTIRGLRVGAGVTAGFVAVFGLFGLLVENGVDALGHWIPWAMVPVGAALAALGVLELLGRAPRFNVPSPAARRYRGVWTPVGFGVTYGIASLSCALPLFLAGVAGSFTRLGVFSGGMTAVAYALGMGLFIVVASLLVSWSGISTLRRLRPAGRLVRPVAGLVLVIVGGYLVYYWTWDLTGAASTPQLTVWIDAVQTSVSTWLSGAARFVGLVFGVVVIGACGYLAFRSGRGGETKAQLTTEREHRRGARVERDGT